MRSSLILLAATVFATSPATALLQNPDCLTGIPTLRQGLDQLSRQNLNNPQLNQQLSRLSAALKSYDAYSPQVEQALKESQELLNSVPPRVCSDSDCVDLSGVKGQAQNAINSARTEWTRVRAQAQQMQNQAVERGRQAADRAAEQMQMRATMMMEKRCREKGGTPKVAASPNSFWVQPKLQPASHAYARLDISKGFRELTLPPGYTRPVWPPEHLRLPGYPRPEIRQEVKYEKRIYSWVLDPPPQFGRRAGGQPDVFSNPLLPAAENPQQRDPDTRRSGGNVPRVIDATSFRQLQNQLNDPLRAGGTFDGSRQRVP